MSNPEENVELETIDNTQDLLMGEALLRLEKNPDFKMVIEEGYLKESVLNSMSLLGVPQMRDNRTSIMEDMISAANLKYYLHTLKQFYKGAINPILSDEEEEELEKAQMESNANTGGLQ